MEYARSPSNQVRMKAEQWKIYQQRFPAMKDKAIFLSIDEYAYFGEVNLKSALAYAMVLQEMLRHTDFLTMGAFTTGASTMDITPTDAVLNTTGQVFKLYGEHFGAGVTPVTVQGDAPQPEPRYPVGYNHPKVRAGSPTYPLDVIAGLSPDGKSLRIGVVNPTLTPQTLKLDLKSLALRAPAASGCWAARRSRPRTRSARPRASPSPKARRRVRDPVSLSRRSRRRCSSSRSTPSRSGQAPAASAAGASSRPAASS
jgi:hypothetical protein